MKQKETNDMFHVAFLVTTWVGWDIPARYHYLVAAVGSNAKKSKIYARKYVRQSAK